MRNIFGHGSFAARAPFMGAPPSAEEALRMIDSFRSSIDAERSADAADFQALVAAGKRRLDQLFDLKKAGENLAAENAKWEATHNNADALQAAQQAFDAAQSQQAQIVTEIQGYRDAVNAHAVKIQGYWDGIEEIISAMPPDQQADARSSLNTCRVNRSMNGSGNCEHGESSLGCKKCQRGRKKRQYKPPPGVLQQMNGGFLGAVPVAGLGQQTTMSPTSTPPPVPAPKPAAVVTVSEGWTPVQIGVGVGILALAVGLVVFSRGKR